jgi:hypothetical protein
MGLMSEDQKSMDRYILQKDIPGCKAGALFVHDKNDKVRGSIAQGCLKLAWTDNGNCQQETRSNTSTGLCAETIVFHASVIKNEEWFIKESKHNRSHFKQKLIDKVKNILDFLETEDV